MKVFISWSGERSRLLAEGLHEFLPLVIQKAKPFMSKADIEAGAIWLEKLGDNLQTTDTGIICLTPENRNSTWIHYEAGALAKNVDRTKICTCLFGIENESQIEWPLAQFQHKYATKEGIRAIVASVNHAIDGGLENERLNETFEVFWKKLESRIKEIPDTSPTDAPPERDESAMIAEVLQIVRGMAGSRKSGKRRDLRAGAAYMELTLDRIQFYAEQFRSQLGHIADAIAQGSCDWDKSTYEAREFVKTGKCLAEAASPFDPEKAQMILRLLEWLADGSNAQEFGETAKSLFALVSGIEDALPNS